MEIPLSQPLLMDGAARTNLWLEGMPMYSCPAQWMLEHPERVQKLQREFLQAGSRMLCTPTAQADSVTLQKWDAQQQKKEQQPGCRPQSGPDPHPLRVADVAGPFYKHRIRHNTGFY